MDWILLIAVAMVCAFSAFMVRTATSNDIAGSPDFFFTRQLLFIGLGVAVMIVVAAFDLDRIASLSWPLLGGLLGSLAMVFVLGSSVKGSSRWISLGPFNLQPSEVGKVVMIAVLAGLVVERSDIGSWRTTLFLTGAIAVPAAVVFVQPDLGTSIIYGVVLVAVLLIAGTPWQHFAVGAVALTVLATLVLWVLPAAGVPVLKGYQADRLTAFVNTDDSSNRATFQLRQSKIAIGAGGALGRGPEGATQIKNDLLPEHHTDFIFAAVSEVYGFVGAALLMGLIGVIIWRALRIAARASTHFDQIVAGSIAAMLIMQTFINIGMNVGLMPVTGIPLPFVSYGGSHTVTNLAAIGLLLAVHRRRGGLI